MIAAYLGIASRAVAGDWPAWRGPEQTGMSREKAVVTKWSTSGENVLWKAPVGGRTTPIVMNGRVFMIAPDGSGECLRERAVCLDADTGKILWQHPINVFHTDIVENRLGWTSVVGDPETGNIYVHATGGEFFCFSRDGKVLWQHSLTEEFGRMSGYGGRLHTPIIDEDRVIISFVYILAQWGTGPQKSGHRYVAFNKRSGDVEWWAQPGGKPLDTNYSTPVVAVINGRRLLVAGNSDGTVYAMSARTGEKVWSFPVSARTLNSSVVVDGSNVYASHSEENLQGTEMGRVACIDGSKTGDLAKTGDVWHIDGLEVGYSSPAIANGRLYVINNSATLTCLDAKTGRRLWDYKLGTVMKGSPVVTADGVIYIGEVNGRFHILKDEGDKCVSLDSKELRDVAQPDLEINGSPAVANGRVYFMTSYETYCLAVKDAKDEAAAVPPMATELPADPGKPGSLHVVPMDVTLAPGQRQTFQTRLFHVNGRAIGSPTAAWSLAGVRGQLDDSGTLAASIDPVFSAGVVRAEVNGVKAEARVRIVPNLPLLEPFDGMNAGEQPPGWIGLDVKTKIVEKDGSLVLQKLTNSPSAPHTRMRAFSGPPLPIGYTVEADLMSVLQEGKRPALSDMGLINDRYKLILMGFEKQARLVTYSPIPRLQKDVPLPWEPGVWYHAKLRVERQGDKALVRGKVWPRNQTEPAEWTIEIVDPCPNLSGSPGLYAYTKGATDKRSGSPTFYDNYQVHAND